MALFTEQRVQIDGYVKQERTKVFETRPEAEEHAKSTRSYCYEAFNQHGFSAGWAVPK